MSNFINRKVTGTNTGTIAITNPCKINSLNVEYTSDANAGNRQLTVDIQDAAGDSILTLKVGAVQVASKVYDHSFNAAFARETTVVGDALLCSLPDNLVLANGDNVVISDSAGIAVGDSFEATLQVENLA